MRRLTTGFLAVVLAVLATPGVAHAWAEEPETPSTEGTDAPAQVTPQAPQNDEGEAATDGALLKPKALPDFENGESIEGFEAPNDEGSVGLKNGDVLSMPNDKVAEPDPQDAGDEEFNSYE